MVSMELIILVLVSSIGISLYLLRPFYEFFMLNLCKYLGDGSVGSSTRLGWQGRVRGRLSLILLLESRSDLLLFTSSL